MFSKNKIPVAGVLWLVWILFFIYMFSYSFTSSYSQPISQSNGTLDEVLSQSLEEHKNRPGIVFRYEEAGRTIIEDWGIVYTKRYSKETGQLIPGMIDLIGVEPLNGGWHIWFPGDEGYQSFFNRVPPSMVLQIDSSPYEIWGDPNLVSPEILTDYELPWTHLLWASVTRSYNTGHGTGKIDFLIDAGNENIVATKNGTIIYANDSHFINTASSGAWWYWNTVVIQHGPNEYSTYSHLIHDSVPQWIKDQCSTIYSQQNCSVPIIAGQIIGVQGNTGYSFGKHVHLQTGQTFIIDSFPDSMDEDGDGDTNEPVFTGYGWALHNIAFVGYSTTQVANWTNGTRLQAIHNFAPEVPSLVSPLNGIWTNTTYLQWSRGDDDNRPNNYPDFWIQVDNNSDFSSPEVNVGWGYLLTYLVANLPVDQNYYWHVNQGDGELSSGWTPTWLFKLDRALPFVNCNLSGPGSGNGWYTGTVNVVCSAHDNTGTNNSGIASTSYLLDGVPQPTTFQVTNQGAHTVSYSATDNAGNTASGSKSAGIDLSAPVINSVAINNGASVTHSTNVVVNFTYTEALSGPWEMCASLNQTSWTCETFDTAMAFSLPNLNQTTHTVYFRLEDRAGNLSTVVSDSIYLDLYPAMPLSTSYQLCQGTVAAAAGTSSSSSYQLVTNLGVPGGTSTSSSYQLTTGISQGCIAPGGNTYLPLMVRSIN